MAKRAIKSEKKSARAPKAVFAHESSWWDVAVEWIKAILVAIVLALLIRWPFIEPFKIPSSSMEPTLQIGDRIFVNKFVYGVRWPFNGFRIPFIKKDIWYAEDRIFRWNEPERWDIVVFKAVEENAEHDILVKRIVGMPGDRIHIANGKIHIDGEPLDLPPDMPDIYYTRPLGMTYGIAGDEAHSVVPEDHYLLLGDNSDASRDGRLWGWAPNEHLLGRVFAIWWPISRWHDFTGFTETWWWQTILGVLALLFVTRLLFGRSWHVMTKALEQTLRRGEHIYVNRIAFGLPVPFTKLRLTKGRPAKRGEIVLCHCRDEAGNAGAILGRLAGLPGEQVRMDNGTLKVNGAPVSEPPSLAEAEIKPLDGAAKYAQSNAKQYSHVPEGHYFVIVDDPEESPDSRLLGWIPREDVVGSASFVWWPIPRIRRVKP